MQHKHYFAALLCGVLCLTGCLKNEESASVAEVRNGKAAELNSIAAVNNAKAQAEVIKANAEATVAAAQAKLLEAQAAKEQAQAALIQAQAELQEINNQIQQVKLQEELEILKQKQAETLKVIAEYEKAIAQAEAAQQEAINALNKALMQAEIDKVKMQASLVEAEQELLKSLQNADEETAKALKAAFKGYKNAIETIYDASAELIEAQADEAKLQADIYYGIEYLNARIAGYEQAIAEAEAYIEYLRAFETISPEELDEKYEAAEDTYVAALTKYALAKEATAAAADEYDKLAGLQNNGYHYDDGNYVSDECLLYTYNWRSQFVDFLFINNNRTIFDSEWNKDAHVWESGISVEGEFVPLFTGWLNYGQGVDWYGNPYTYIEPLDISNVYNFGGYLATDWEDYEIYPADKDGVRSAYARSFYNNTTFVPAHVYTENINGVLDEFVKEAEKEAEKAQKELDKAYDAEINGYLNEDGKAIAGINEEIAHLQKLYDAVSAYVEEAEKAIKPKEEAIAPAEAEYKAAQEATRAAAVDYAAHFVGDTRIADLENAKDLVAAAEESLNAANSDVRFNRRAVRNLSRILNGTQNENYEDEFSGDEFFDDDDFDEEAYLEFITEEGLLTKQAAINAAVKEQGDVVNEKKAKVTSAISEAYETAKNNLKNQYTEVIPDAEEKERTAWNELQAAFRAYSINPSEANEKTYKDKHAAYYGTQTGSTILTKGALQELQDAIAQTKNAEEGEDETLKDKFDKAKKAFDDVNDPYEEAEEELKGLQEIKAVIDAQVEKAQTALVSFEEALTEALSARKTAKANLEDALAAQQAAYDNVPWIYNFSDPENPYNGDLSDEDKAVIAAVVAAYTNERDAKNALDEAENALEKIMGNYANYEAYKDALDPKYATVYGYYPSPDDSWGWPAPLYDGTPSMAQRLADAQEHLQFVNDSYAEQTKAIADNLASFKKDVNKVKDNLKAIDSYKASYEAWGEKLLAADKALDDALKAEIDATIAVNEAAAEYNALNAIANGVIFANGIEEGRLVGYTIKDIEEFIYYRLEKGMTWNEDEEKWVADPNFDGIEEMYKEIAALEEDIANYYVNEDVNLAELAKLQAKIETLETKIAVYNALAEMYANQIAALTGTSVEEIEG